MEQALYRGMDRAALDAGYNNSLAVATSADYIARWQQESADLRAAYPAHLDLRYGPAERNRTDFLSCGVTGAPTLVFIHGGYWQRNAKEGFTFIARGPLAHGINVALVGYTLAPEATLTQIIGEVHAGLADLRGRLEGFAADPEKMYISGWSAGGHLTASSIAQPGIAGGLSISGVFDLEPIRLNYLNEKLGLDAAEARACSPLFNLPKAAPRLVLAAGGAELPELRRQSVDYGAAWAAAGLPGLQVEIPGCDHFSILEELASPEGRLTKLVRDLVG